MPVCQGGLLRINGSEMSPRNGVVVAHATCARVRRRGFVACCTQVLTKREEGAMPPPPATRPKCGRPIYKGTASPPASGRGCACDPCTNFDIAARCATSYKGISNGDIPRPSELFMQRQEFLALALHVCIGSRVQAKGGCVEGLRQRCCGFALHCIALLRVRKVGGAWRACVPSQAAWRVHCTAVQAMHASKHG